MKFLIFPLCLTLAFVRLSTAQDDFECNVTQAGGLTTYRVPDFKQSQCEYSWSNASNFPLANSGLRTDPRVVSKNETTLITRECIEKIMYRRSCGSERGKRREATCETNCTETIGAPPDELHPVWTGVAIAVPLVVGLMLGGLILCCRRCRRPDFRRVPA